MAHPQMAALLVCLPDTAHRTLTYLRSFHSVNPRRTAGADTNPWRGAHWSSFYCQPARAVHCPARKRRVAGLLYCADRRAALGLAREHPRAATAARAGLPVRF